MSLSRYPKLAAELNALAEEAPKRRSVAEAAQRKTQITNVAETALAYALNPLVLPDLTISPRIDDGEAPGAPQNVTTSPVIHGLTIDWDDPLPEDRVRSIEVEVTPTAGSPAITTASTVNGHTVLGLAGGISHNVRVRFIDVFDEPGTWSSIASGTPFVTAAESINFAAAVIAGSLGWDNLDPLTDPDKMGDDVVTARAMAVQNAAAVNLWAQNGAFQSAKIESLVVDKMIGGILNTTDIHVASGIHMAAGGQFKAGDKCTLDDGGLSLFPANDYDTPSMDADQKISVEGDWAALAFYVDAPRILRGAVLRADGGHSTGDEGGTVALIATTDGDASDESSGVLNVVAGNVAVGQPGFVQAGPHLLVGKRLIGAEFAAAFVLNGGAKSWTFSYGGWIPFWVSVQISADLATWFPVAHGTGWAISVTATTVNVVNGSGASVWVRAMVIG